jgi:hypothetical protein
MRHIGEDSHWRARVEPFGRTSGPGQHWIAPQYLWQGIYPRIWVPVPRSLAGTVAFAKFRPAALNHWPGLCVRVYGERRQVRVPRAAAPLPPPGEEAIFDDVLCALQMPLRCRQGFAEETKTSLWETCTHTQKDRHVRFEGSGLDAPGGQGVVFAANWPFGLSAGILCAS